MIPIILLRAKLHTHSVPEVHQDNAPELRQTTPGQVASPQTSVMDKEKTLSFL